MTLFEIISLLLIVIAAVAGGAYQIAKANYYFFIGMHIVIYPILIFACGFIFGLNFSPIDKDLKIYSAPIFIALFVTIFCLAIIKDITKPKN